MTTTFNFRNATTGVADATVNFFEAAGGTSQNRLQSGDQFTINIVTMNAAGVIQSTMGTATISAGTSTVQAVIDTINSTGAGMLNVAGQSNRVTAYLNDAGNLVIENNLAGNDASGFTYAIRINMTNNTGTAANTLDAFSFSARSGPTPRCDHRHGLAVRRHGRLVHAAGDAPRRAASFREVLNQIATRRWTLATTARTCCRATSCARLQRGQHDLADHAGPPPRRHRRRVLDRQRGRQSGDAVRDFQSDREITLALGKVRAAKSTLAGMQATFATNANILTNRQDFNASAIKNFNDGADLLTLADINEEGANLTSLQTASSCPSRRCRSPTSRTRPSCVCSDRSSRKGGCPRNRRAEWPAGSFVVTARRQATKQSSGMSAGPDRRFALAGLFAMTGWQERIHHSPNRR